MVDPNRKINRFTEKDIEFLNECDEEFKDRYTENDEEFMQHCRREIPPPPIIDPWSAQRFNSSDKGWRGGRGGGGFRDNSRNFRNNRRGGDRGGYRSGGYGRFQNRGSRNDYRRDDKPYSRNNDDYGRFGRSHQN